MVVAWLGFSVAYLCVCVSFCFSRWYLKHQCSCERQTWHRNVPLWVQKPIYFGIKRSKVRVTQHKKTRLSLLRWNTISMFDTCVSYAGFSCVTCARPMLPTIGFPHMQFFTISQWQALRHGSHSFTSKLHHACLYFPAAEHHCPLTGTHFIVPRRVEGRDVNRVPGPEKTTWSRVSNYPKATPASAFPLRNDRTAGTAGTV